MDHEGGSVIFIKPGFYFVPKYVIFSLEITSWFYELAKILVKY